jgi:hypothetical protein
MRGATLLALALAAPALALAAPALAQTSPASQDLPVTGSVPRTCALQQGRIEPGSLVNIAGLDGDTLRIIQFVDPASLAVKAASATIAFEAVCNFPHAVRIESQNNGLWPTDERISDRPAGFTYAVPYAARVSWGPITSELDTDGKVRSLIQKVVAVDDPVAGSFSLRIQIAEGASNVENRAPVIAGTYVDTVRIFLEPR